MKKLLLLLWCAPLFAMSLEAQNVHFSYFDHIPGTSHNQINDIEIDVNGNDYMTGIFRETADFGINGEIQTYISEGIHSMFVQKRSSDGQLLFNEVYHSTEQLSSHEMYVDINENIYIVGTFLGTVDFDSGAGVYEKTTYENQHEGFVLKLDANGSFVWVRTIETASTEAYLYARDISVYNGSIFVTGVFKGTVDLNTNTGEEAMYVNNGFSDNFLIKLNEEGDFEWANIIDDESDIVLKSISADNNGNVIIAGRIITSTSEELFLLRKYDSLGTVDWTYTTILPEDNSDFYPFNSGLVKIQTDPDGSIYGVGHVNGTINFGPEPLEEIASLSDENMDMFVCKFSSSGEYLWANVFPYENASSNMPCDLDIDKDGHLYVAGFNTYWNSPAFIAPYKATLYKFNAEGEELWMETWSGDDSILGHRVAVHSEDNILLSGEYSWGADFAPGPEIENRFTETGPTPYLLKLSPFGVGIEENILNTKVYSNPYSNNFSIVLEEVHEYISIALYNSTGQIVAHFEYFNTNTLQVDLPDQMGLYIADVRTDKGIKARVKLTKN